MKKLRQRLQQRRQRRQACIRLIIGVNSWAAFTTTTTTTTKTQKRRTGRWSDSQPSREQWPLSARRTGDEWAKLLLQRYNATTVRTTTTTVKCVVVVVRRKCSASCCESSSRDAGGRISAAAAAAAWCDAPRVTREWSFTARTGSPAADRLSACPVADQLCLELGDYCCGYCCSCCCWGRRPMCHERTFGHFRVHRIAYSG